MQSNDEIYSLLIPLNGERIILPRASVAEVIRYAEPEAAAAGSPEWLLGDVVWHGKTIPLISFEALCGNPGSEAGSRSRIIVVYMLNPAGDLVTYGLLAEGFPQIVRVNRDVLLQDLAYQPNPEQPVLCRIRMINETALIPDLPRVETAVAGRHTMPAAEPERPVLQ